MPHVARLVPQIVNDGSVNRHRKLHVLLLCVALLIFKCLADLGQKLVDRLPP